MMDSNLSGVVVSRQILVGTGERLDLARAELARAKGRNPNGIVLLDVDERIVLMNAEASRLLDLDPRRALGRSLQDQIEEFNGQDEFILDGLEILRIDLVGGSAYGIFDEYVAEETAEVGASVGAFIEAMLSRDSVEDLMLWLGDCLGEYSFGQRGAIALRDGDWMVVWSAWPMDQGMLMPLRFLAMDSAAFRTGNRGLGSEFEIVSGNDVSIVPVVVDGSVMALVAYEGNQPDVEAILPHLGMALRRFVD